MNRIVTILTVLTIVAAAQGDWDPGDPYKMHHPQLPMIDGGIDVLNGPFVGPNLLDVKFLADDFRCSETGAITSIHLWSSYLEDRRIDIPPLFNLAIYSDIPAVESPTGYSMPGELLWSTQRNPDAERIYDEGNEIFYNPNDSSIMGVDTQCWQYNFEFSADEAFRQEEGKIYWLGASRSADFDADGMVTMSDFMLLLQNPGWAYGWKNAREGWNDAAVWTDVAIGIGGASEEPPTGPWNRLGTPDGVSLDLAFVIVPEPATMGLLCLGVVALLRRR
jgi:PEP-CTERM motif-containing protein